MNITKQEVLDDIAVLEQAIAMVKQEVTDDKVPNRDAVNFLREKVSGTHRMLMMYMRSARQQG